MAGHSDYMAGWINTTIHDFLQEIDEIAFSMAYALITYLDSNPDVASVFEKSKSLSGLKEKHRVVGTSALVTTRQLLAAERKHRLFYGFDEVWFFPYYDVTIKPDDLVITAPYSIESQKIEQHHRWLVSNKCSLGIGDGVGMNYCLKIRGVAKYIVQAINEGNPHALEGERERA